MTRRGRPTRGLRRPAALTSRRPNPMLGCSTRASQASQPGPGSPSGAGGPTRPMPQAARSASAGKRTPTPYSAAMRTTASRIAAPPGVFDESRKGSGSEACGLHALHPAGLRARLHHAWAHLEWCGRRSRVAGIGGTAGPALATWRGSRPTCTVGRAAKRFPFSPARHRSPFLAAPAAHRWTRMLLLSKNAMPSAAPPPRFWAKASKRSHTPRWSQRL